MPTQVGRLNPHWHHVEAASCTSRWVRVSLQVVAVGPGTRSPPERRYSDSESLGRLDRTRRLGCEQFAPLTVFCISLNRPGYIRECSLVTATWPGRVWPCCITVTRNFPVFRNSVGLGGRDQGEPATIRIGEGMTGRGGRPPFPPPFRPKRCCLGCWHSGHLKAGVVIRPFALYCSKSLYPPHRNTECKCLSWFY